MSKHRMSRQRRNFFLSSNIECHSSTSMTSLLAWSLVVAMLAGTVIVGTTLVDSVFAGDYGDGDGGDDGHGYGDGMGHDNGRGFGNGPSGAGGGAGLGIYCEDGIEILALSGSCRKPYEPETNITGPLPAPS